MEIQYQTTKRQEFFRQSVRKLAQRIIAARVADIDNATVFPPDIVQALGENHLLGLLIPKEYGGEGAGFLDCCIMIEELGRVCCTSAVVCATQNLAARLIMARGNEEQKGKYLGKLASGEAICGVALDEPVAIRATPAIAAVPDGESYVLDRSKEFVANGDIAHIVIVFASGSCFLIEKGAPGFSLVRIPGMTGCQARYASQAMFVKCRIPKQNLLGTEGDASDIMTSAVAEAGCANAARAVGIALAAAEYAADYSKKRYQFGRPIARFQAIGSMLATMATRTEAARQLVYKAASLIDQGSPDATKFGCMAKHFASDTAMSTTTDAVQILGGYGYMRDYPIERLMRAAKLAQITEVNNKVEELLIARSIVD
ncbi:MAG: acyl-CoA dehydrogenase family protein [Chloroflexota bacterium]